MYLSCDLQTLILPILSFIVLYASYKLVKKPYTRNGKTLDYFIPEPPGSLPLIGHLHLLGSGKPVARVLGAMADKLGPTFTLRLGQHRALVLSKPELVKECLTTHDRLFANRPSIAIGKYVGYDGAAFAISPYGNYWRDVRKLATLELLSSHRVKSLQHVLVSEVDSFVKRLAQKSVEKAVQPLSELIEDLTFDVNARLIIGKQFSEGVLQFKKAVKEALYLSGVFVWSDVIPWLGFLDVHGHVSSMKRVFREIDAVLQDWLEEHCRARSGDSDVEERDLMSVMLSSISEDDAVVSRYSRDTVIKATALILMLTGTESTAVTLTWAISLLLNNPTALMAAQKELDAQVGRERWVQESDIPKLPFLQAILKETLRLYPPGPITGPREAAEDCTVGGHRVPKGTRLIVNIWKLQRDPSVWVDPCEFRPERFMTENAHLSTGGQSFEYIPFSSGRRSCPGMGLGLLVVQLVLARLVQGFYMVTEDGKPVDMREGLGIALPKLGPVEVVLSPRLPSRSMTAFEVNSCAIKLTLITYKLGY